VDVVCDGCSPVFRSDDCVDIKWLRFLSLNVGFVKDLLNYCFIPVRSPCASELRKNVSSGVPFAGNVSYLYCFEFFHFLEY